MRTLLRYMLRFPAGQLIAGILFVALGALLLVAAASAPTPVDQIISGAASIALGAFFLVAFALTRNWKHRARVVAADAKAKVQAAVASGNHPPGSPRLTR